MEEDEPEVIVIDDRQQENIRVDQTLNKAAPAQVRVLCFCISIVTLLWAFGALLASAFAAFASACTLFRNELFTKLLKMYWGSFKTGCAVTTGLVIGVFSPLLGLSVIMNYFIIKNEQGTMAKLFKNSFGDYVQP